MPLSPQAATSTASPSSPSGRRTGIFHRESTRLRSNVADQVQRDLLPAGRMLSVFLIICELLAEIVVLIWSRGQKCDRPLRFWVQVLIILQTGTVVLNCLNIWQGRDSFGQHRNGLSATDLDMYTDSLALEVRPSDDTTVTSPPEFEQNVVVDVSSRGATSQAHASSRVPGRAFSFSDLDTQPLLHSRAEEEGQPSSAIPPPRSCSDTSSSTPTSELHTFDRVQSSAPTASSTDSAGSAAVMPTTNASIPSASGNSSISLGVLSSVSSGGALVSTEFVDRYVRIVNAWYLVWFILGSVWVSDGGTCSTTAPHLYRLIVALTIIYYALLFLPLACFCLIVCCLPLFIVVYRIMLPYAERERRRARAADPAHVESLSSITYSADTFRAHTGNDNLDDTSCVICLCDYEENEVVRFLPCKHHFHKDCVDVWLRLDKACCLCKQDIDAPGLADAGSSGAV